MIELAYLYFLLSLLFISDFLLQLLPFRMLHITDFPILLFAEQCIVQCDEKLEQCSVTVTGILPSFQVRRSELYECKSV